MSETGRVLVVEDERAQREALQRYLTRAGHTVQSVPTGEEAVALIAAETWDVLITDLRLPGIDGLEVVRRAAEADEELSLLLITAFASVDSAIEALRLGAHDYLLKPLVLEEVGRKVQNLLQRRALIHENARLRRALQATAPTVEVVARSSSMKEVMRWAHRAASSRANVLITGETGTGKEVLARAIHRLGAARDEPFLPVNLAAIPSNMVESHLFGHERGAFTGATQRRVGLLRAAGRGTVFLDEIAELSPALQAKLLRALEAREVQPIGSDLAVPFDARTLAATHRDLEQRIEEGSFREDLYYRLNVVRVELPPLRERPEDIPALARMLVGRHAARVGIPPAVISAEAMRTLCQHHWRGNVRELSNVLERAMIMADDGRIDLEQLPSDVSEAAAGGVRLQDAVERFQRQHISMVLRLCDGNREAAAAELGISSATLYRRLDKLQI